MEETYLTPTDLGENIRCVTKENPEYPERLKKLPGMPDRLYVKGSLPADDRPTAAVVGARRCSTYGRIQAFQYAKYLSCQGVQVISGLATGIDTEGHKGALEGKTPVFAVLGNGVDICYPAINRPLYQRILKEGGGIFSEYPPGTKGRAWHFPERNRIISALSDVVLVVEAQEKSGSLITAGLALEQGKAVYAVPGAVNEPLSEGCHRLIYDGAGIAYHPEVLLSEWGIEPPKKKKSKIKNNLGLATDLNMVYSCLDLRPKNIEQIIEETGLSPAKTGCLLTELSLLGMAREHGRHYYVRADLP